MILTHNYDFRNDHFAPSNEIDCSGQVITWASKNLLIICINKSRYTVITKAVNIALTLIEYF